MNKVENSSARKVDMIVFFLTLPLFSFVVGEGIKVAEIVSQMKVGLTVNGCGVGATAKTAIVAKILREDECAIHNG